MGKLLHILKKRWGVESPWQVLLILFIFSITGFTTLHVKHFIFDFLGFGSQTALWMKIPVWLLVVVPSYQLLFLGYGFILGQFEFVWQFEKKSLGRLKKLAAFFQEKST